MTASGGAPPAGPIGIRRTYSLQLGNQRIDVGPRTLIMGVLNCTPDSFYDGGCHASPDAARRRFDEMVAEGADWVDVGGESTRPGASPIDAIEEWQRIAPVLDGARRRSPGTVISIDTTKYEVAARALDAGAVVINDVSALRFNPRLAELAARYRAGLILMHMRGTPRTMQKQPHYDDLLTEVGAELAAARAAARARGVRTEQILFDPGIGFGKTADHNFELLARLGELASLDRPLLIGCSRKRFLGAAADLPPAERLEGTLAAHTAAVLAGAHIVRVHDVRPHVRAMRIADALRAHALTG
ncbi:MAG: dihydropteroate synthase [Candidatus Eisenbacteria bacterium]|nr:dihydropteroate synthase [Candidatus Eisenbacteria bacterium]